jgi:hypothetical protein
VRPATAVPQIAGQASKGASEAGAARSNSSMMRPSPCPACSIALLKIPDSITQPILQFGNLVIEKTRLLSDYKI